MLERPAGHLDTVWLLGQPNQLAINQFPPRLLLASDQSLDFSKRESDLAKDDDQADFSDRRWGITPSPRPGHRPHQSQLVVVTQRACRHVGASRQFTNGQQLCCVRRSLAGTDAMGDQRRRLRADTGLTPARPPDDSLSSRRT